MPNEYEWKRFWCPRGASINLDGRGYLYDPDTEFGRKINPFALSFEDIKDIPCLMLLGEPGMGKSRALLAQRQWLEETTSSETDVILSVDLRAFQSEDRLHRAIFDNPTFLDWLNGSHRLHLFIDSLDEGLLRINTIAALLAEELRNYANDRFLLRIACRTAEWPQSLESVLRQTWGDDEAQVFELTPLRRIDVALAAAAHNIDYDKFLDSIDKIQVVPLAIKPITLEFLLNKYRVAGTLPSKQADLYHEGILLLCEETNEGRRDAKLKGVYSAKERMLTGSQIAAVTIFSNRYAVWTDLDRGDVPQEDVRIEDLCTGREDSFSRSEAAIRETLATGLFSLRGEKRLGWAHQTYAEYLAAYYLVQNQPALSTIMRLMLHPDGKLVPQLYETAAWLGGMRPDVFNEIAKIDPEVLLRSDIATADIYERSKLVSTLLDLFDRQELLRLEFDAHKRFDKLNHPNLSQQLQPYIADRTKNSFVREFAIDVAEACGLDGLEETLVAICLNPSEQKVVRVGALHAIYKSGSDHAKAALKSLLATLDDDPDDELKGYTLLSLWPNHITADELFRVLTPPKRQNFVGAYHQFLSPQNTIAHLQAKNIPTALAWVEKQPGRHEEGLALRDVMDAIMLKAWFNLDAPGVAEAFARAAFSRLQLFDAVIGERERPYKIFDSPEHVSFYEDIKLNDEKRRKLITYILPLCSDENALIRLVWAKTTLITQNDLNWLIERLHNSDDEDVPKKWAYLIYRVLLSDLGNTENLTRVFYANEQNEILAQRVKDIFDAVVINSDEGKVMRENYYEWKKITEQENNQPVLEPSPTERVAILLDRCESGNYASWWQLNREMTLEVTSHFYGEEGEADLTQCPGWKNADDVTRGRIIEAAKKYVLHGNPQNDAWLGKDVWYYPPLAGYRALFLIFHHAPNYLETLTNDLWQKWAASIVAYPISYSVEDEEQHGGLIRTAYQYAASEMIDAAMTVIDKENNNYGDVYVVRKFEKCWDSRLLEAIRDKLQRDQNNLKPNTLNSLLQFLLEKDAKAGKSFAQSLIQLPFEDEQQRTKVIVAATALMLDADDAGWSIIWPMIQADTEFGKDVIGKVVGSERRNSNLVAAHLTEKQVADLYIWVAHQNPHKDDPKVDGFHTISTREEISSWRESLLKHLRNRGTTNSLEEIRRIMTFFPDLVYIKQMLIEAEKLTRQRTWIPLQPLEVISLVLTQNKSLDGITVVARIRTITLYFLAFVEFLLLLFALVWFIESRQYEPAILLLQILLGAAITLIKYEKLL